MCVTIMAYRLHMIEVTQDGYDYTVQNLAQISSYVKTIYLVRMAECNSATTTLGWSYARWLLICYQKSDTSILDNTMRIMHWADTNVKIINMYTTTSNWMLKSVYFFFYFCSTNRYQLVARDTLRNFIDYR